MNQSEDAASLLSAAKSAARAGEMNRADELATSAATLYPDNLDVNLFYGILPCRYGNDELAYSRLSAIRERIGSRPWIVVYLSRVATRLYNFGEALDLLDLAIELDPKFRIREVERASLSNAWKIAQEIVQQDTSEPDYRGFLINLDHDSARLELCTEWFRRAGVEVERLGAVRGRYLPEFARAAVLSKGRTIGAGTLGCFLSHVSAWEAAAASTDHHALVLEDDARPLLKFGQRFSAFGVPSDYDICFVNRRMAPMSYVAANPGKVFQAVSLGDVFSHRGGDQRGAGFDGYFLSKTGAAKMLEILRQDKIIGHVDMQVLASSLSVETLRELAQKGPFFTDLYNYSTRRASNLTLRAYSLWPPLVHQEDTAGSTHRKENESGHP